MTIPIADALPTCFSKVIKLVFKNVSAFEPITTKKSTFVKRLNTTNTSPLLPDTTF